MRLKSPANSKILMTPITLADGLTAHACPKSGGHWISHEDYMDWLNQHGETLPEKTDCEVDLTFNANQPARICPECGRILIKYKVGHGLDFAVDHCPGCGGVWLDQNEWEALQRKNLHDEIHKIFSTHWQSGIRQTELREKFGKVYTKRFGAEAYEKLRDFHAWLHKRENAAEMLAYLEAEDPYAL